MNFKIEILLAAAAVAFSASAGDISPVGVDSIAFNRQGEYMTVDLSLDLSRSDIPSSRAIIFTPAIVGQNGDSIALPSLGIYGRQRYFYYLRNDRQPISGLDETSFRRSERPESFSYHAIVPYADWMNGSQLTFTRSVYGCCNDLIASRTNKITEYFAPNPAIPEIVFIHPQASGEKTESLEGSAFIDFPVDQTVIYPEYRNNIRELAKVRASIDSVRNDRDVTITQVWLKGFASPESPYAHNTDLAIGRTAALKKYIGQLYEFDDAIIATDYEPEDWAGLRRFVVDSDIDHRDEILALIDSDLAPDAKEAKIKRTFPKEYRYMLKNYYPALRHTDYRIDYRIRRFTDINELRRVFRSNPRRLDIEEIFLLGQACEPGSDEFNEVFETAVRMFPDNPVANVNAANAALSRGDFATAEKYLDRAGDTPEAVYTRGAIAFLQKDYDRATQLMNRAKAMGIPQAQSTLEEINRLLNSQNRSTSRLTLD